MTTSEPPRVTAIVPAAGRSRRMGFLKQHATIGSRTMLDAVLDTLMAGGVDGLALVASADVRARLDARWATRLLVVANDDPTTEMIDSIRLGLSACERQWPAGPLDGFLVCPADHPDLSTDDVRACLSAFRERPERIVVACLDGRHGHPLIFPAALAAFVQSPECDGGLNVVPRTHAARVWEVPCSSPGVIKDVDTPDDLA